MIILPYDLNDARFKADVLTATGTGKGKRCGGCRWTVFSQAGRLDVDGETWTSLTVQAAQHLKVLTVACAQSAEGTCVAGETAWPLRLVVKGNKIGRAKLDLDGLRLYNFRSITDGGAIQALGTNPIDMVVSRTNFTANYGGVNSFRKEDVEPSTKGQEDAYKALAVGQGGAMALSGGTTITIDGSLFQRNGAFWGGGAIFSNNATISITETKFIENYVDQDLDLTLDSTRTVKCGGALDLRGGSVSIAQSEFRENRVRSPNSEGGAIFALDATLHITATTLVANVAGRAGYYSGYYSVQGTGRGGAICIRSSILVMQDSILEKNVQLAQAAGSPPGPGSTALDANGWISQQSFVTLKNVTFGKPLAKAYTWKKRNEPKATFRQCGCVVPPCKYIQTGSPGSCQLASGWSYPYTGAPCSGVPYTCQAPAGSPASAGNKFVSTQSLMCTRPSHGAGGKPGPDEHVVMPNEDTENLVCVTNVFTRSQ